MHALFKSKHAFRKLVIFVSTAYFRIIWIRMIFVEEFYNMKPTSIHIEMNIPFFKVWCHCFPGFHLWVLFSISFQAA